MTPRLLITGAAGKTGRAVSAALLARRAAVRALVRRPQQATALRELGVMDVVVADLQDADALARTARGIHSIYHICPNMHPDEFGIGAAIIDAALAAGVSHLVYHSVLHPQTQAMPHHWQKLRVEERLLESGLPFTILQPAPYMQNLLAQRQRIVEAGEFPVPYAASTRLALVDLADVGAAAATVLLEPGHRDAIYELVGEAALTQNAVAAILSRALGRAVAVAEQSVEDWRQQAEAAGLGSYQRDSLIRMFHYYNQHGLTGNPTVLRWLLGRPPGSLASFAGREFG